MNRVQVLAEQLCPKCHTTTRDIILRNNYPAGYVCPTCDGTGALVAGLRRACQGFPERLFPMPPVRHDTDHCNCEGRGWTLIPAAEQMGVLVRCKKIEVWQHEGESFWRGSY